MFVWTISEAREFVNGLTNHEKTGMPVGSGTTSSQGLELSPMKALLSALGEPQEAFDAIHVVGSKGKGSTATFISSALRACGYRVGSYTSPHVLDFTERISVGEQKEAHHITSQAWWRLVCQQMDSLVKVKGKYPQLSFFETTTALALLYFQQERVDIAVLEAGMGGARDATNVTPNNRYLLGIVTAVGMEHLEALGGSLESIVKSKVGIARPGKPLVVSPQDTEIVPHLIEMEASKIGVNPLCQLEKDWCRDIAIGVSNDESPSSTAVGQLFSVLVRNGCCAMAIQRVWIPLLGEHQVYNALAAICALHILQSEYNLSIPVSGIKEGFSVVSLPGRIEVLPPCSALAMHFCQSRKPGSGSVHVVLDGAHTIDSAKSLNTTLKQSFPASKFVYIVAMAKDKDIVGVLREIISMAPSTVVFTDVSIAGSSERAASLADFLHTFKESLPRKSTPVKQTHAPGFQNAIDTASSIVSKMEQEVVVVFVGSLYLVGEALRWNKARGGGKQHHELEC